MIIFVSTLITLVGGKVLQDEGSTGVFFPAVKKYSSRDHHRNEHANDHMHMRTTTDSQLDESTIEILIVSASVVEVVLTASDCFKYSYMICIIKLFVIMVGKCMTVSEEED